MIITIDTDKDSPERLRQAASFLRQLAGDAALDASIAAQPAAHLESVEPERIEFDEGMLNLFSNDDDDADEPAPARITPY